MTGLEAAQRFKIEINKLDRSSDTDLRLEKVLHYLNKAALFLVKKKYRGVNPGPGRLEIMHPVLDDLKVLLVEKVNDISDNGDEILVALEQNHLYFISCRIKTKCNAETAIYVEGRYVKPERVYKELQSPFTSSKFDDPVFTFNENKLIIYKKGFLITKVKYKYLKMPNIITSIGIIELPFEDEIIDTAITMALENFESGRIKTQPQINTASISE